MPLRNLIILGLSALISVVCYHKSRHSRYASVLATAFGLIVAIPCMIAFSILSSKANTIIEEIDESSVRLLNFLFVQRTNR